MKPLRIVYSVVLVLSLGLTFILYYHFQLKDKEADQYQRSYRNFSRALKEMNTKLVQSKKELEETAMEMASSIQETARLNKIIGSLEKDNLSLKEGNLKAVAELQALKEERERLQIKIARLAEDKAALEEASLSLGEKLRSLEELRKAIRIAKIEKRRKNAMEKIKERGEKIERLKTLDEIALRRGNKGYLVKKGKTTFKPTIVRVELEPINTEMPRKEKE